MKNAIFAAIALAALFEGAAAAPAWRGYAGDEQHNAQAPASPQSLANFHWTTQIDLFPQLSGDELLIHYASPMITAANTVIVPVKTGATGGFELDALNGATGALLWQSKTDYVLPPHAWVPSFPAHLSAQNDLYYAGPGGSVLERKTPDQASGKMRRLVFYGNANYIANKAAYKANVMIDTPITADNSGNIFFGFVVTGSTPVNLQSGIARIAADGTGTWISAAGAANDSSITQVAMNCAPAVSRDQTTIYIAVSNGTNGYLVGLDATTLQPKYRAALVDPSSGDAAMIDDASSAAPTVGPDGDVYYGVLENPFPKHDDRGWLLHFDETLTMVKTPGSFGWDLTASIVPRSAVPSYKGHSPYLLMTKDNNYLGIGPHGNGHNRIAIVDPDVPHKDLYSSVMVMKDIASILGPTQFPGAPAGAVYEWCINSAVVDAASHSIIANSEDGHVYHWDLGTNALTQSVLLNAPRPEAYTPSIIGPDGTVYVINNSTLYAIGN